MLCCIHARVHAYDGTRGAIVAADKCEGVFVGEGSMDQESTLAGLGCRGLGYFFNNQDLEMMGRQVNSVGNGIDCDAALLSVHIYW